MSWNVMGGALAPRRKSEGIAWREAGHGRPVLLLHGVGLNADAFEPQIRGLSPGHRVIAPDLPGHGESDPLPADAGLEDYVAAIAEFVTGLGVAPLPVVGHSFGAMVALGLALARPELVGALVTLNAVYCRDPAARAAVEGRARQLDGGHIEIVPTIMRWYPDSPDGPLARRTAAWLRGCDPRGYAQAYRIFATGDRIFEGRLGELTCPALFMTGVADPNSTPAMSERMAHEARDGQAMALPRARHMMHLTHPAEVTAIVQRFIDRAMPGR